MCPSDRVGALFFQLLPQEHTCVQVGLTFRFRLAIPLTGETTV